MDYKNIKTKMKILNISVYKNTLMFWKNEQFKIIDENQQKKKKPLRETKIKLKVASNLEILIKYHKGNNKNKLKFCLSN